ncbi:hypothetical protein [Treponema sp. OMZ 799]|uniref:hypothetical protein n=1 Tax=Treponema sp. OMZ 799 TaxID=2563668 RepID=UPI0020A2E3A5|nr:hypothetical protein [Treponema sp. OMZ 799]
MVISIYNYVDNNKIKRLEWEGDAFASAADDAGFAGGGIQISGSYTVSAMAANKDGLFVAVKDTDKLIVKKYHRDGTLAYMSEINTYSNSSSLSPVVEFIHSMQILNGRLYAVSYKTEGAGDEGNHIDGNDSQAVVSGRLLDLGPASGNLSNEPTELWRGTEKEKGYAPYRFIAVKPKELVIANDGFYGEDTYQGIQPGNQRNKVLTFSLSGTLLNEISTNATFSRELEHKGPGCGFIWY